MSYTRLYDTKLKKALISSGITLSIIFGMFWYLSSINTITITSYSGNYTCAGTESDPCYAYINFTANKDIYIYPINDTTWSFRTSHKMKKIIMQRKWGNSWRTINLSKPCNGAWCGCGWCDKYHKAKYAYKFVSGRNYSIRFVGYKYSPYEDVKWGFDTIDPVWVGVGIKDIYNDAKVSYSKLDYKISKNKRKMILYSGIRYIYEDNKWKPIEYARSLKNSPIQCVINSDGKHIVKCVDYNFTSITLNLSLKNEYDTYIPLKVFDNNGTLINKYNLIFNANNIVITIPFKIDYIIHFGKNSTTVRLQEANIDILDDASISSQSTGFNDNGTYLIASTNLYDTYSAPSGTTYNASKALTRVPYYDEDEYGKKLGRVDVNIQDCLSATTIVIVIREDDNGNPGDVILNDTTFSCSIGETYHYLITPYMHNITTGFHWVGVESSNGENFTIHSGGCYTGKYYDGDSWHYVSSGFIGERLYRQFYALIKINLTKLYSLSIDNITESRLCFYAYYQPYVAMNAYLYNLTTNDWYEDSVIYYNVSNYIGSLIDTNSSWGENDQYYCFNVTDEIIQAYSTNENKKSFAYEVDDDGYQNYAYSKDYSDVSKRPYLDIEYTMPDIITWSQNSTNNTDAGQPTMFSVYWETNSDSLSGYIFSWYNGSNWTKTSNSGDKELGEQGFNGEGGGIGWTTFFDNFDDNDLGSNWTTYSSDGTYGRIGVRTEDAHSGGYSVIADVNTNGHYNLNELITNYDFSGATEMSLTFWHREWSDEETNGADHTDHYDSDAVYFTCDGTNWKLLGNLGNVGNTWTEVTYNLTADPDWCGTANSNFKIKFTQYDNYALTYDGRGFDDINITYKAEGYGESDQDANKTPVVYQDVISNLYEQIDNITVTVNVSYYDNSGSQANGNTDPTLWLEVFDGSNWIDEGDFQVTGTGNFSITVTTPSVLQGWKTESNRDIRISARYMDYSDSSHFDTINWTDVWVDVYSEQEFLNDSWVEMTGTGNWSNVTKTITSIVGATIKWRVYANSSDGVWNVSDIFQFTTTGGALSINISIWNGSEWKDVSSENMYFRCFPTQTECEPTNQDANSGQCIHRVCNNGTSSGEIDLKLSSTCTGWTFKASNTTSYSDSITLDTSYKLIYQNLNAGQCIDICYWADLSNPDSGCQVNPYYQIV